MGRQVNFFMMDSDLAEVETVMRKKDAVSVVPFRTKGEKAKVCETISEAIEACDTGLSGVADVYLVQQQHLSALPYKMVNGYTTVDQTLHQPAIEFSVCKLTDNNTLTRGRFYYHEAYNVRDVMTPSALDFLKWARGLCNWVRRVAKKDTVIYTGLVFPSVLKWIGDSKVDVDNFFIRKLA